MDRVINIKVGGYHLTKDNNVAGVRGEGNVQYLRITFDENWDKFAKTITFYDAQGNNPVKRTQGVDLIEDITTDARTYLTPIPPEPMAIAGNLTFVIDGYYEGTRQRSISDELIIKDAPITDNANEPTDITPTQAEQLQGQIDYIKDNIQEAVIAKEGAEEARNEAEHYADRANNSAKSAEGFSQNAFSDANMAITAADKAMEYAGKSKEYYQQAQEAISYAPYIEDNGNWFVWDALNGCYVDTGTRGQAGSEVYVGDNPPDSADVIIDPNGESALYAPYIGENGNWYTFNPETQTFTDSGVSANGKKGDAYILTDEDKTEIGDEVSAEIEAELNDVLDKIIDIQDELNETDADIEEALKGKVDKEEGKGLSTNDFTDEYKFRIDNLDSNLSTYLGFINSRIADLEDSVYQAPITTIPTTLSPNKQYNFGEVTELALAFPMEAEDGDVIYATFMTGETATALTIDTTNTCDIEFVPEPHTGYEVFGKFNGSIWIVNYSEYTVSEG